MNAWKCATETRLKCALRHANYWRAQLVGFTPRDSCTLREKTQQTCAKDVISALAAFMSFIVDGKAGENLAMKYDPPYFMLLHLCFESGLKLRQSSQWETGIIQSIMLFQWPLSFSVHPINRKPRFIETITVIRLYDLQGYRAGVFFWGFFF